MQHPDRHADRKGTTLSPISEAGRSEEESDKENRGVPSSAPARNPAHLSAPIEMEDFDIPKSRSVTKEAEVFKAVKTLDIASKRRLLRLLEAEVGDPSKREEESRERNQVSGPQLKPTSSLPSKTTNGIRVNSAEAPSGTDRLANAQGEEMVRVEIPARSSSLTPASTEILSQAPAAARRITSGMLVKPPKPSTAFMVTPGMWVDGKEVPESGRDAKEGVLGAGSGNGDGKGKKKSIFGRKKKQAGTEKKTSAKKKKEHENEKEGGMRSKGKEGKKVLGEIFGGNRGKR